MKRKLNCPRCAIELKTMTVMENKKAVEIDICTSCEGIWFDEGELEQVENFINAGFVKSPNVLPSMRTQLQGIKCPSCNPIEIMLKSTHPKTRRVIIDSCQRCNGIWLDGGELGAIQSSGSVTSA